MNELNGRKWFDGDIALRFKGGSLFELEGRGLIRSMSDKLEIKPGREYEIQVKLIERDKSKSEWDGP